GRFVLLTVRTYLCHHSATLVSVQSPSLANRRALRALRAVSISIKVRHRLRDLMFNTSFHIRECTTSPCVNWVYSERFTGFVAESLSVEWGCLDRSHVHCSGCAWSAAWSNAQDFAPAMS